MDALGESGAPGQMRGMIGAVGVVDLEANDSSGCRSRGSGTDRTIAPLPEPARTSHPSTRQLPVGWRCAWWADAIGVVAWRGRGGSSGHAYAAPDGSWIRWRYRRLRRPTSERSGRAGSRRNGVRWRLRRCVRALPRSERATVPAGSHSVAGRRGSVHHSAASVAGCADRSPPERWRWPAARRRCGLWRSDEQGSGDPPGGSCVLAVVEDRR